METRCTTESGRGRREVETTHRWQRIEKRPPPLPVRGERNENEMEVRRKKWRGRGEGGSGRGGIIDADMCSSLGGSNP